VPLLPSAKPLRKNGVLASNLLFANLLLTVGEYLFRLSIIALDTGALLPSPWAPVTWWVVAWALLFLVLRAGLYYAVRQGILGAKLLVAFFFIAAAYFTTNWRYRIVAGVSFHNLEGYSWLALVDHLLALAALLLMFKKPRVASGSTVYD
jgi:hypothetical protein